MKNKLQATSGYIISEIFSDFAIAHLYSVFFLCYVSAFLGLSFSICVRQQQSGLDVCDVIQHILRISGCRKWLYFFTPHQEEYISVFTSGVVIYIFFLKQSLRGFNALYAKRLSCVLMISPHDFLWS